MEGTCEFCGDKFPTARTGRPAKYCAPCRESMLPYRWEAFRDSLDRWQALSAGPVREVRSAMFRAANEVRATEQRRGK